MFIGIYKYEKSRTAPVALSRKNIFSDIFAGNYVSEKTNKLNLFYNF